MTRDRNDLRARVDVAVAALLFSTGGAAIKLSVLSGWQVAGLRSIVASAALWLLLPRARGRWTRQTFIVALFYAGTLISFALATKLTTAGNAIFLQSTAPLYVLFLAPLVLREPLRRIDFAVASLILIGLYAILTGKAEAQASAPHPALGNALGVLAGLCWSATLMGLRGLSRSDKSETDPGTTAVVAGNVLAFVFCTPFLFESAPSAGLTDVGAILYLGLFQVGAAYAFLTRGLRRVPAFSASLIILIEPALNPVWAYVLQGESIGWESIIGGVLILAASITKTAAERR